jgi:hypothetical protein
MKGAVMYFRHVWILPLIIAGLTVLQALAIPRPVSDLDKLTEESTLIVLGELASVEQGIRKDTIEFNNARINVRVDRGTLQVYQVLKGYQPGPSITYESLLPQEPIGWRVLPEHAYGLFFFRLTATGMLVFTNPYDPYIPASRGLGSSGDTPLDRVISVLGAVTGIPDSSQSLKQEALWYLEHSKSNASSVALRAALSNPDPVLAVSAARALMRRGDGSGFEIVKRVYLPGPQSLPDNLEETVANAIGAGIRDPKLIPDLEELLDSSSKYMRRGVTEALIGTTSPKAVTGLRRALADSDFEVRYNAVVGLAEIMGEKAWRPSREEFRSDESKYLSHWREAAGKQ